MARRRESMASKLAALRAGLLTFPEFVEQTCSTWERMAAWFTCRWVGQAAVGDEDVYQEILIAVWRAVDSFDPARGVALERYVLYQAGNAATRTMQRSLHWTRGSTREQRTIWSLPLPRHEQQVEQVQDRVAVAREALAAAADQDGLEAEVASALLRGANLGDVAKDLYRDREARWRFWLGSEAEAHARVLQAARKIGKRSETA